MRKKLHRLFYWEFWPVYMFYIPNLYYALYHAIKEKSLTFYTLTNPGIVNGGIGTESKFKTQSILPKEYLPKTIFYSREHAFKEALTSIKSHKLSFPLIVKPDIGFRGLLVKKINNKTELKSYLEKKTIDFIIQEYIDYPNECGIFYIRHPRENQGKITSITLKDYPRIKGDGVSTIKQLITLDKHLRLFQDSIVKLTSLDINFIPKKDQIIQLTSIGNHAKGTKFINGKNLISNELNDLITKINTQTEGWYYGRLDIKYKSWENLLKGEFKIIELNGILGEPTHIYDTSQLSYLKALKTIRNHWKDLHKIAAYHHKKGMPYKKTSEMIKDVKTLRNYIKKIKSLT